MPLSSNSAFGALPMTLAINKIPATPTIIRGLGLFRQELLTETYVRIARQNNMLELVPAVPRGAPGEPLGRESRDMLIFDLLHLPENDVVLADDVQNLRQFGSTSQPETVASVVAARLARMKEKIELTREYHQLGALQGQILNKDGSTVLLDIYQRFGLTRKEFSWDLGTAATNVGKKIDETFTEMKRRYAGETISGWACLCSPEFMQALVYHKSIEPLYVRFQDGKTYREGETNVEFIHKGIRFIQYDYDFGNGIKVKENEAILLPLGTKSTFVECFAPANYSETVNTKALPYYAKRVAMEFDKGWKLEAQSNPLPLVTRPELVATIKAA